MKLRVNNTRAARSLAERAAVAVGRLSEPFPNTKTQRARSGRGLTGCRQTSTTGWFQIKLSTQYCEKHAQFNLMLNYVIFLKNDIKKMTIKK